MRTFLREAAVGGAVAATTTGAVFLLGLSPWSSSASMTSIPVFLAAMFVISLAAALDRPSPYERRETVRLAFVGELVVLIFYGPVAMTVTAVSAAIAPAIARPRAGELRQILADAPTAAVASLTAGYAYSTVNSDTFPFANALLTWPGRTVPLTIALVLYALSVRVVGRLADALVARRAPGKMFLRDPFRLVPSHIIAGAIGVFVAEVLVREAWDLLSAAAVPLSFAWAGLHRRRSAVDDRLAARTDSGIATLDEEGRIVGWNANVARMFECPAEQAIGRTLIEAVPALADTGAAATLDAAARTRAPQVNAELSFRSASGFTRVLTMTAASDPAGALMWVEVSEAPMDDSSPRAATQRLALIARGANDGLWELNARTQSLYVSPRWRQIVGVGDGADQIARDEWLSRVHPEDITGLLQAIDDHVLGRTDRLEQEHRVRHADTRYRRVLCRGVGARDPRGRMIRIAGSLTDITETANVREQILTAGQRDSLTALLNRSAFVEAVAVRLREYKEHHGAAFATLCLDIDRFKVVNDSLGHVAGDEMLVAVSRRLEKCTRDGDAMARLGGDEFAILVHGLVDATQANVVAFRVQEALAQPLVFGGREVVVSASIGIAFSRPEYTSPDEMIRDADTAMHHAKTHGKARHELYDADMHKQSLDRLGLETDLRNAVKANAFEVYYQPIVSLHSRMCIGFESLIRWKRNGKFVSPAEFIPMAEELGLIDPIGTWVMEQACRSFVGWQRRFPEAKLQYITVNVSARQLIQQGFVLLVEDVVEKTGIAPGDLRLEITETAVMDAPRAIAEVLNELRKSGFKIYLDDFGTGYSSLSHLHKLPVDALKIDQSFVRGLLVDDRPAIVESILALARTLHTSVVAEGVEDERQAHELQRLGCVHAQGYLFSRPIPVPDVEALLSDPRPMGTPQPVRANVIAMRA